MSESNGAGKATAGAIHIYSPDSEPPGGPPAGPPPGGPPAPLDPLAYGKLLLVWAMIVAASVVAAVVQRWIGPDAVVPPPPAPTPAVLVVQPDPWGGVPVVTLVSPSSPAHNP